MKPTPMLLDVEKLLGAANELMLESYDLVTSAMECWGRADFAEYVRLMRGAVTKHGCAAVIYEHMATEGERLMRN